MGIGNLNVSCSADINPAVASIGKLRSGVRGLRDEVRAAGPAFGQLESQINRAGNTAAEFEKKFAGAKKSMAGFGSSVDLSGAVDRYDNLNKKAEKHVGIVKQLNQSMQAFGKTMKAVSIIAFAPDVAMGGFQVGNAAGKKIFGDYKTDGEIMEERRAARERGIQERRRAEYEKQVAFDSQLKASERASFAAQHGEEKAQQRDDVAAFGQEKADQLARQRAAQRYSERNAAIKAAEAAGWQAKEEERINALHREREKMAAAYRKKQADAMANQKKDEQTVRDLQREVADYWKSPQKRREEETLRNIEDPQLKRQASYAFQQLRIADRVKAESDARNNNPALSLAEAGTRESYVQRAAIRRQAEGDKNQKEMIVVLRQIRDNQDKKSGNLPAANI